MPDSSESPAEGKATVPSKPRDGFPLFAHQSGRWAKKFRGKIRYYGRWGRTSGGKVIPVEDIDKSASDAELEFSRCWPYHSQGREAPDCDGGDGITVADLANRFLSNKLDRVKTGELSKHSFSEYHRTCEFLVKELGKTRRIDDLRSDDFESLRRKMSDGVNLVTLKSKINRARVVFKFAHDSRLIDRPVEFGKSFDRPSPKNLRALRNEAAPNIFERDDILRILTALDGNPIQVGDGEITWPKSATMKAMVLLGLNAGFGNTDVSSLPRSAVNLETGWIKFPRPKTAIQRRIPLWPETISAVRLATDERPNPIDPDDAGLCFLTERGTRFMRVQESKTTENRHVVINAIARRFDKLLVALAIEKRKGAGFYTLRHVFETVAGDSRDQVAVDSIMGHADPSMAAQYREGIKDDRLLAVVNHVREWLWPETAKPTSKRKAVAK